MQEWEGHIWWSANFQMKKSQTSKFIFAYFEKNMYNENNLAINNPKKCSKQVQWIKIEYLIKQSKQQNLRIQRIAIAGEQ